MAVTNVSISNDALLEIGAQMITSMTEDSEQARLCNHLFDELLDQELELSNWSFAIERVQLAQLSSTPDFGWAYEFQLPTNPWCLHVIDEYNDNDYKIEGRKLLADSTTIQIRYIKRVTDLTELSALFRRAFTFKLASKLALPLQGSGKLKDRMETLYEFWYRRAEFRDAQGSGTPPEQEQGSWLDARLE